jgi:hypothetical protein
MKRDMQATATIHIPLRPATSTDAIPFAGQKKEGGGNAKENSLS